VTVNTVAEDANRPAGDDSRHRLASARPPLDLDALLAPRSVAVVGASPSVDRHPGRAIANLQRTGYAGRILPVNPKYAEVLGIPCVPDISAAGTVDTAYVLVGAERVTDVVSQCVEARVRHVVVCTSGFAEEGSQGRAAQERIATIARQSGTRIIGPNCIGVLDPVSGVIATPTLNIAPEILPGSVAVVSQSGGMGVNVVNLLTARGHGTRALVSVGNECDVDVADLVTAFSGDARTTVIALFLEQVRRVDAFLDAVRTARAAGKHVVALKVGASEAASRSSLGHTGAMTGSHEVFRAVMAEEGVVVLDTLDTFVDVAGLLSRRVLPRGPRLLVVSPSGGECSYVADRAQAAGLLVPPLGGSTTARLAEQMRFGTPGNPLDLTGAVIGDPVLLRRMIDEATADGAFDAMLVALPTWGAHDAERLLPVILEAAASTAVPTVVSTWSAGDMTTSIERLLRESPVATFADTESALRALGAVVAAGLAEAPEAGAAPVWTRPAPGALTERPVEWSSDPSEHQAKQFFATAGIAVPREIFVPHGADIPDALRLRWPLVVKQLCSGVEHKSDLGLVRVGVRDAHELTGVRKGLATIVEDSGLTPLGLLLAEQASGVEVIVGGVRDSEFGPMIMIGAGGILTEVLDDHVLARCPVSPEAATALLGRLRLWPVLAGHRGRAYDVAGLARLVATASELFASSPWMEAFDLNPVIVGAPPDGVSGGAVAVDAAIHLGGSTVREGARP